MSSEALIVVVGKPGLSAFQTQKRGFGKRPLKSNRKNDRGSNSIITRAGDVLRGSNGRRWKALPLSFPTTPWSTHFDLKTLSYG